MKVSLLYVCSYIQYLIILKRITMITTTLASEHIDAILPGLDIFSGNQFSGNQSGLDLFTEVCAFCLNIYTSVLGKSRMYMYMCMYVYTIAVYRCR